MSSIKKNFLYSSILTTANYLFPLLTFPYVSRVLGVTNVGIVNFIDSIIYYFILMSMMGIGVVGIREVAKSKGNQEQLNQTYSGLFWLNTSTTTIALVILLVFTVCNDKLYYHWQMMLIGALKLVMNYMLIEWLYKGLEEFKYVTIRTLIVKTLYVMSVFIFVRNQNDYPIYYFLSVMMIVLNSVINLIYSRHYVSLQWSNFNMTCHVKSFFILGIYSLLTSMYTSINISWLGFVSGETEVGYYTTASKLYKIIIALFTAFTGVMLPRMSSLLAEGKMNEFREKLAKANNILFTFSIPLIVFTVIYAPFIINVIAGPGYEGAVMPMRLIMPLMLVIGYEQILIVQALMPLKKDNAILRNSIAGAITGLLLNLLLVSSYASIGASLVWVGSELVVLCSAQHYVTKYLKIYFPWRTLFKNIVMYILMVFIILFVYRYVTNMLTSICISVSICIIYFLLCNLVLFPNKELLSLFPSIKKFSTNNRKTQ